MMRHPIPIAALDDRLGFLGTSGSGKTYNAGTAVEILLQRKARVVILDPLGVWWGLRLLADGKKESPFNIVIFGGPRGDLPLTEHSGALIGETAASMAESCIIDLSELASKAKDRRFTLAFLEAIYQKAGGEPFHLIVDEADLFAPQKPQRPGDEMLLHHMEQIVRRGRVKGFIPWLISQRPAVLNNNVLSQVDGLLAFKLTGLQDRDALDSWIEGQADKAQGRAIKDSLPTLQVGHGIVWIPGRGVLDTATFPPKLTFDSSRTPKRGEKAKRTAALKPLDLGKLKERLGAVEAEAKASDPRALRSEIATLKAELARLQKLSSDAKPTVDHDAIAKADKAGFERGVRETERAAERQVRESTINGLELLREKIAPLGAFVDEAIKTARKQKADLKPQYVSPNPVQPPRAVATLPKTRVVATDKNGIATLGIVNGDDRPLGAERKPLSVLVGVLPAGMTEAQWAVAAGLKRTGGTWSTYLSRLRMAGRVMEQGGLWYATDKGREDVGADFQPMPPPGRELVAFWKQRITAVGPMLDCLAEFYPHMIERSQLATTLDLAAGAGTFNTYLSRLRSAGLIEEDGQRLRAAPSLMG